MAIVGGGAAGFAAADAIRKLGWRGRVCRFSEETEQPYDRTLLTKDYLEGAIGDDQLSIAGILWPILAWTSWAARASNKSTPKIINCDSRTGRCAPEVARDFGTSGIVGRSRSEWDRTERKMTKARRKIDAALKAKIALEALRNKRRQPTWRSAIRFIPTRFTPGRSSCWTMRRGRLIRRLAWTRRRRRRARSRSFTPRLAS